MIESPLLLAPHRWRRVGLLRLRWLVRVGIVGLLALVLGAPGPASAQEAQPARKVQPARKSQPAPKAQPARKSQPAPKAQPAVPPSNDAVLPSGEPQTAMQLFNKLATLQGLEASFVETKQLALLRMPLKSAGTLYYMRPGYLLRVVEQPKPSRVLITPTQLQVSAGSEQQTIDLRARPDVKLFVESFTKVLAGDAPALASGFDITFKARPHGSEVPENQRVEDQVWTLTLTPKRAPLNQLIAKLTLSGKGYAVERIRLLESKGDSSETVLSVKRVGRTFSAAEKQKLFGITAAN